MNLVSMLVPLETLPGWPPVATPSALQILGLLVGIPAVAFLVIAGLAKVSAMVSANKYPQDQLPESVWLNSGEVNGPSPEELRPIDGRIEDAGEVERRSPDEVAAESPGRPQPGQTGSASSQPDAGRGQGGASARW